MWKSLLKLSVVSYIWKRYKRTLIAFPLLLLYFWGVGLVHEDFISYATLEGDKQGVGWSFLIKWLLILVGIAVFIAIHLAGDSDDNNHEKESFAHSKGNSKSYSKNKSKNSQEEFDAFSNIRNKDKLRTKADVILERGNKK